MTRLFTLLCLASIGFGADKVWWSQFRGPNSSGIGDGKPPVQFGVNDNVLWKVPVGSGISSPVIWGNYIFYTEFEKAAKQFSTVCIDRRNGKPVWRKTVTAHEVERVHEISNPAAPTPVTDGERVYVYFGSYGLLAYDMAGKLVWERTLPVPQNHYGAVSSPIIAGAFLIFHHHGKEAYLAALNPRTGDTVWKTDRSQFQYGWSTPVHWRHDGIDEILVLGGDFKPNQRLMAYNLFDGKERWWIGGLPPCGKSTPVVGGGMVYFAAPDIILEAAAVKKNPDRAAQLYENNQSRVAAVKPGGKGEVNATHVAWSEHRGTPGVPSPLYYKGQVYSFLNGGIVYARDATNGSLVFNGRIGEISDYYSSPIAADNRIYISSAEGTVVVLEAGRELKVLARNKLDSAIMATPALADNTIYVRTASYLYAFGK